MYLASSARAAVVAALVAAAATAAPRASAAENQLPLRPAIGQLSTGQAPCDVAAAPTVHGRPTLNAVLDDPDGDDLTAQFEVAWTDAESVPQRVRFSADALPSGSTFSWKVPAGTTPAGDPVQWRVRAKDAQGYGPWSDSSHQGRCGYVPASETEPSAGWLLDDEPGSSQAAPWAGGQPARAGAGAAFGAEGPNHDTPGAVTLDGEPDGYLSTDSPAVDSTDVFTLGVWVRPEDVGTEMTAVSQTGLWNIPDFTLGTTVDSSGQPAWSFRLPSWDGSTLVTGGAPQAGQWTYLAGVYDTTAGRALLYADGELVGSAEAAVPPDTGQGTLQMGRTLERDGVHYMMNQVC